MSKRRRREEPARHYYALSETALERLAAQGDTSARTALWTRAQVHRMATAPDCSPKDHLCWLGDDLWLHFRKDQVETSGRVNMFLEIGEHMALDTVKRHWEEIQTWRDLLLTWQGPWHMGGRGGLFHRLHVRQAAGESYRELAARLNETVARDLATYREDARALQEALTIGALTEASTRLDLLEWQHKTGHWGVGLGHAKDLLREMGLQGDEMQEWCPAALENLQQGQPAFPPGQPITRERLRDALRAWRTQHQDWLDGEEARFQRRRLSEMRKTLLVWLEGYRSSRLREHGVVLSS